MRKIKSFLIIIICLVIIFAGGWWVKIYCSDGGDDRGGDEDKKNDEMLNNMIVGGQEDNNGFCQENCSPISGLECSNYNRRPIMVMLGADEEVRPLSGLQVADMMIEMPVVTGGINRFAAIYVCNLPEEIGSVRSARDDFIPLAKGMDAILAHWGGSHFALEELNNGVIDNIDALPNPFDVFYRKKGILAPHNGFTSNERLLQGIQKLGYRLSNNFSGYPHLMEEDDFDQLEKYDIIIINYPEEFKVKYQYSRENNNYLRIRGGKVEKDLLGGDVYAKVIVVIEASSRQIEGQYNDVDIIGEGDMQVFQNNVIIKGRWKKDSYNSKLYFNDLSGKEIKLLPGQIWLQIIEPESNLY